MFFQRRNAARTAAEDRELQVLLADLAQRQQEIVDRGRSENYLYVVFFTAIGAIIAGMAALFSLHLTTYPVLLPTLVSVGFLVLLCLPVNLIHLGSVTELRGDRGEHHRCLRSYVGAHRRGKGDRLAQRMSVARSTV